MMTGYAGERRRGILVHVSNKSSVRLKKVNESNFFSVSRRLMRKP